MLIVPNTVIQLKAESKKPKAQSVDKRLLLRRHNFQLEDFHSALQLDKRAQKLTKKRLRKLTLVLSSFSPSVDTWDQDRGKLFFVSFP